MPLTPKQIADAQSVDPDTVRGWIRSGELPARNLAAKAGGRPRYRVDPEALAAFLRKRAVVPTGRLPPRPSGVSKYFGRRDGRG